MKIKISGHNFLRLASTFCRQIDISGQCCGAGRSQGFLAGAGADLKFELETEPIFWGRLQLLLFKSEKENDFKKRSFFIAWVLSCTYFCIINSTC